MLAGLSLAPGSVVAGAFLSALWFVRVLRRLGLRVRFTQV